MHNQIIQYIASGFQGSKTLKLPSTRDQRRAMSYCYNGIIWESDSISMPFMSMKGLKGIPNIIERLSTDEWATEL